MLFSLYLVEVKTEWDFYPNPRRCRDSRKSHLSYKSGFNSAACFGFCSVKYLRATREIDIKRRCGGEGGVVRVYALVCGWEAPTVVDTTHGGNSYPTALPLPFNNVFCLNIGNTVI